MCPGFLHIEMNHGCYTFPRDTTSRMTSPIPPYVLLVRQRVFIEQVSA